MALGNKNLEAQYAKALSIGKTPEGFNLLKQAALGQNDDFDQLVANMALKTLTKEKTAIKGLQAQQQLAQGAKQTVRDRILAEADSALPESLGIGRLPAPNMAELGYADGGVVGYADTGLVAPEGYEMYEDPTTGEVYQRKVGSGIGPAIGRGVSALGGWLDRATTPGYKKTPEWYAQNTPAPTTAQTSVATAPAAAPALDTSKVPGGQKTVSAAQRVAKPVAPVENPTDAQKSRIDQYIDDMKKLQTALKGDKGDEFGPIKEQLANDRKALETMKSENVGLALLSAAGALLRPGQSTASAIGSALGTVGEMGVSKIQPQLLAARQGLTGSEMQLAQARAAADKGDMATAAALIGQARQAELGEKELAMKAPLYAAQAQFYGAKGSNVGSGAGLGELRALQSNLQAQLKAYQGKVDPESKAAAARIQSQLDQVGQALASRSGIALNTGFVSKPGAGMNVTRSSLFEE